MIHVKPPASTSSSYPRRILVTVEDHKSLRLSVRRLASSNAVVATFPAPALPRVASQLDLTGPGIFLLVGTAKSQGHALSIYVGRTQQLLKQLASLEPGQKSLQIAVIAFARKPLNDEQGHYVQARLIETLTATGMINVENRSSPARPIRDDLRIVAERFLSDALLLLGPVEPMLCLISSTAATLSLRQAPSVTGSESSP